ncbi:NAD(P)H:quinone oxidoreductase [Gramella sp. BOM4]|nr:NAD(P)H:quinone oxidoreductase [Christiangramia bathymodioli]
MEKIKLAVIYYSATGTNYQMAKWATEAARESGDYEVKMLRVEETAPSEAIAQNEEWKKHYESTKDVPTASVDDLDWADAFIFSIPTRYGNMPNQFKALVDSTGGLWFNGKLVNKVVSGMTSAQNPHGGQETTLLSLYKTMFHWGAIVVPPSYTDQSIFDAGGNPYGVSVSKGQLNEKVQKAIQHQVKRTLQVAGWVKKGNS